MAQIITGSIFILVGLVVLFFTVKIIATDFVTNHKGIDTIADVVSAKEDRDGMLNVKISYTTDEGKQTDRLIETPDKSDIFHKGSSITIRYNPKKPFIYKITEESYKEDKTTLGLSKSAWNKLISSLISAMLIFMGTIVLFDTIL